MKHVRWRLLVVAVAVVFGCRGLPLAPKQPTVAEPLAVGQLVIHTDFDLPHDHRLVLELVAERDDVCSVLDLPPTEELIHVYLFRDAERYERYLARYFPSVPPRRAFFVKSDTRLSVYAHWSDRVAEDLRHEVAHGYLHAALPDLPLWLDEGLAEYFEVPRGHGGLNRPHVDLLADMTRYNHWQPDLRRLEQLSDAGQLQQIDYAESWAWVYWLLESTPEGRGLLQAYLADLREQGSVEPLSLRLAQQHVQPDRTLIEFVALLGD